MADPNASPVAPDQGALQIGSLQSDLAQVDSTYDPQISASESASSADESQAVAQSNKGADEAEKAAGDSTAQDAQMKQWVDSTPTRQAAYATAMHTAPVLALLVALGGAKTKLTGGQMLAATTGIVQGMNAGAEKQYTDSYNAWMASYQKMKDQHAELMKAHELMLESYAGRADAYQKAAEAARRQTGDLLEGKKQKIAETIDTLKAQSEAVRRLDMTKIALEQLHERQIKEIAQVNHWKAIEAKTGGADPRTKALIGAAKQKFQSAKALMDKAMQYRGQISSSLDMSAEDKAAALARVDMQLEEESAKMEEATQESEQLAQAVPAPAAPTAAPAPLKPASPPVNNQAQQLPPARLKWLQQHKGQEVGWADGTKAIMKADGTVQILSGPTMH
jgi:hypothetical protein